MTKPVALQIEFGNIPQSLKDIDRWVLWNYVNSVDKKGVAKWKKVPLTLNGEFARSNVQGTWSTYQKVTDAYMLGDFDGIGIVINGSGDFHGIDFDDCIVDGKMIDEAKELLQKVDGYAEISPSGDGIKLFTRSNLAISGARKPVEVYKDGRYFTVTGHVIPGHTDLPEETQDVSWFVEKHFGNNTSGGSGDGDGDGDGGLALYKPILSGWDLDRVHSQILPHITDIDSYDGWMKAGMALHHQGQGDDQWMELWDEVSKKSEHYDRGEIVAKWKSFTEQRNRGQGAITLASLIKDVNEQKVVENTQKFEAIKKQIEDCQDPEDLRSKICVSIQKDGSIEKFYRDVLASILKAKFRSLEMPVSIGDVKNLIRPRLVEGMPDWLEDWVYVTHSDMFFNTTTKRKVKMQGFNAMYNREVGGSSSEPGASAAALALDVFKIPTPDKVMYIPWAAAMFDLNGTPCVNSYNVNAVPDIPAMFSKSDLKAIQTIKDHLKLILETNEAVDILINWMAHNVQKPGIKIRWVPLIKGIQGDGKSLIGKVLSAAMGHVNVGIVSPDVISGQFSSWSEGRCINVVEEIRMVGHNRHDVVDKLKTYISNDHIEVHRKGENPYDAPNVTNYITFTNYQDAIPLDDTDRRWWIQFTPFSSEEELKAATSPDYFKNLHDAIRDHQAAIRRWLLEVVIPETFEPDGRAPDSHSKQKMIAMNVSDEESAARSVIEEGCYGVSSSVVSTSHLMNALEFEHSIQKMQGPTVSRLMSKMGFTRVPKPVRWQNATIRVWIKDYRLSNLAEKELNLEVRKQLDLTIKKLEDDILS